MILRCTTIFKARSNWSSNRCATGRLLLHGLPVPFCQFSRRDCESGSPCTPTRLPPAMWSNMNLHIDVRLVGMVDVTQHLHLAASSDDRAKCFLVRRMSGVLGIAQQKNGLSTLPTHCQGLYCSFVRTQALQKIGRSGRKLVRQTKLHFHRARMRASGRPTAACINSSMGHTSSNSSALLLYLPQPQTWAEDFRVSR